MSDLFSLKCRTFVLSFAEVEIAFGFSFVRKTQQCSVNKSFVGPSEAVLYPFRPSITRSFSERGWEWEWKRGNIFGMTSGRNVAGMSHLVGNFSLARQANFLSELEKLFDGTPNPDVTPP